MQIFQILCFRYFTKKVPKVPSMTDVLIVADVPALTDVPALSDVLALTDILVVAGGCTFSC